MIRRFQDSTGRTVYQDMGDSIPVALGKSFREWLKWTRRALNFAIYEYRKARKKSIPFHARIPIDDPILTRLDQKDSGAPGHEFLPQDEAELTVYKTENGRYFTESFLKNQEFAETLARARITMAAEISDERAETLCDQLDALELEVELTDNEKTLRTVLREHLAGAWAK